MKFLEPQSSKATTSSGYLAIFSGPSVFDQLKISLSEVLGSNTPTRFVVITAQTNWACEDDQKKLDSDSRLSFDIISLSSAPGCILDYLRNIKDDYEEAVTVHICRPEIQDIADRLLAIDSPSAWPQAVIEIGSLAIQVDCVETIIDPQLLYPQKLSANYSVIPSAKKCGAGSKYLFRQNTPPDPVRFRAVVCSEDVCASTM